MSDASTAPDHTAVRVALWRALHVELDAAPHVLVDTLGRDLVAPPDDWHARPDMEPTGTRAARASIVARARCIEDLVIGCGAAQYVLLGAGLDTFAQRRAADAAAGVRVFEIDQAATQAWKRARLAAMNLPIPTFVPVNFEVDAWWERLVAAGFDPARPAVVASTGVTMYLTKAANIATLRQLATSLAPGSTIATSYLVPHDQTAPAELPWRELAEAGARRSGTPFVSFFDGNELVGLARAAGFRAAHFVSGDALAERYYSGRSDGLRPSTSEQILVAAT